MREYRANAEARLEAERFGFPLRDMDGGTRSPPGGPPPADEAQFSKPKLDRVIEDKRRRFPKAADLFLYEEALWERDQDNGYVRSRPTYWMCVCVEVECQRRTTTNESVRMSFGAGPTSPRLSIALTAETHPPLLRSSAAWSASCTRIGSREAV